jgi:hypothetical protein
MYGAHIIIWFVRPPSVGIPDVIRLKKWHALASVSELQQIIFQIRSIFKIFTPLQLLYFSVYKTHQHIRRIPFFMQIFWKKIILVYFIMHLLNKKYIDFSGNSYITNNLISKKINLHPQIHKNRHLQS